jgi:hypothetical protein
VTATLLEPSAPVRSYDSYGDRFYEFPPTGELWPSFSTVKDSTWYKPWIARWQTRVATRYMLEHASRLYRLVRQGKWDEAFEEVYRESERIWEIKAALGSYVHAVIEAMILREGLPKAVRDSILIPELPPELRGKLYDDEPIEGIAKAMIQGFEKFCAIWKPKFLAAEMAVYLTDYKVAGTLDFICVIENAKIVKSKRPGPYGIRYVLVHAPGHRVILCGDAKTGRDPGECVVEQLATYRRGKLCDVGRGVLEPMLHTDAGVVLHLRPEFEDGFELILIAKEDDAEGWNTFRDSLSVYLDRSRRRSKPGTILRPAPKDGTEPPVYVSDLHGEGYGAVPTVLRKAGIKTLDDLAALDEKGWLALFGIGKKRVPVIRKILVDYAYPPVTTETTEADA